ncbi:hypothetical protein PhaeoP83_02659 [Phaeobacter inhibens]|uniref:Uncharacterized protein n=1 Tax=Phaeobacter inhibens TaxID=221822 RepID=A0ABN5GSA2_9RHOB|nr:hypothetical protein [Phaeobacter inhibens]AUQ50909.1 hypothetical protein PhaeoP83_02659 [Phaeobacter inhibens]AUQ96445.1 hypothetical protein PhaeoP66_03715 [Phaeobacter inhibens]AUR20714.1 hypothetical protein PhaeoP80_02659 [Phaeobacter inhibens]
MTYQSTLTYQDYPTGHPWYYFLGGKVLTPKQILEATRQSGYQGYRRDGIAKAADLCESQRSAKLRAIRDEALQGVKDDLTRYRQLALTLYRHGRKPPALDRVTACDDIHTNISLKHNHLVNGFAHLLTIDLLLSQQGDLFGF